MAFCLGLAAFAAGGCSLGYVHLDPGENSGLYAHLFADVITNFDEPHWLWVRGTINADFDGDGKVEEEAVIATIQSGTPKRPGPVEAAFLVICRKTDAGERVAMARTLLFDHNPIHGDVVAFNDIGMMNDVPLTRVKAQMVQDKLELGESIVVYFWGDESPTSVWYAGYHLDEGELKKNLETVMWQTSPGFLVANLDKRLEARGEGYQLLFPVASIPPEILSKVTKTNEILLWGHVLARDKDGFYRQNDQRFGEHYRRLEGNWNQMYLRAAITDMEPADLAWFEYHLALLNHYTDNPDLAERFLAKAKKYAADPRLLAAIVAAEPLILR